MKNLISDAIRLCEYVDNTLLPSKKWAIVNAVIKSNEGPYRSNSHPQFGLIYTYDFNDTLPFLIEEEVIEYRQVGRWFDSIVTDSGIHEEKINVIAREKGYISRNQKVCLYFVKDGNRWDFGPQPIGLAAILINRQKLNNFLDKYKHGKFLPKFDPTTGEFTYKGEKIIYSGDLQIKSFSILFENINSIVTKEELYRARGLDNYSQLVQSSGSTKIHETIEATFKKIKKKIEEHPILKELLVPVQHDGFGIFINQKKNI